MNRKYDYYNAFDKADVCRVLEKHPEWHIVSICCIGKRIEDAFRDLSERFTIFYYTEKRLDLCVLTSHKELKQYCLFYGTQWCASTN